MDYESLIADLQKISQMNSISHYKRDVCAAAATALSTLQAENEKLRAELEQVKAERDAAVKCIEEIEDALNFLENLHQPLKKERKTTLCH